MEPLIPRAPIPRSRGWGRPSMRIVVLPVTRNPPSAAPVRPRTPSLPWRTPSEPPIPRTWAGSLSPLVRCAKFVSSSIRAILATTRSMEECTKSFPSRAAAMRRRIASYPSLTSTYRSIITMRFSIPIPTFGEGLVEGVTDGDLINNLSNFAADKTSFHIAGRFNHNGNDGTITRFGWKAQNKSMFLFSGEASNVEMGVTNEVFQNEKVPGLGCATNGLSEDNTHVLTANPGADPSSTTSLVSSAVENFALFMRLNGTPGQCAYNSGVDSSGVARCISLTDTSTPAQAAVSKQIARGKQLFGTPSNGGVGCVLCHSQTLTSGTSDIVGLNNRSFTPFSDFALHHMGATLADGINQGLAGADEFRTAPLWGVGQRLFFMHDGRATDLLQAVQAHFSDASVCFNVSASEGFTVSGHRFSPSTSGQSCGSEANESVRQFNALCAADKTAIVAFLRSL